VKNSLLASIALLSIGLATTAAPAPPAPPAPPASPAADRELARSIFKELIEINTNHEHGSTEAANAIARRLRSGGFADSDITVLAPQAHPKSGNVIVRYRGATRGTPVLFLGHLDVVDARREDWSVDPFKLTEQDGWFYGRGTIDMKDADAALLEALLRLRREGFVPAHDVIAAFTADEEAGGDANGPAFLLKEHRDLIDAGLVINLDGGGGAFKGGKRVMYEIGTSEKTYVTYTIETTSPGGHGSLPGADNAIYRLASGLGRIEGYKFPVMLTATTRASFTSHAALDPGPDSADMLAVAQATPDLAAAERLSHNDYYNAQLRTTCVATLLSGGHAENALPQRAKATIQCRMLPGDNAGQVEARLVAALNDPRITIKMDAPPIVSPESPLTPQVLGKVTAVVHAMWPGVPVVPGMATGFSDDRQTRNAGMPSYDASGIWIEMDENRAHGRDERVGQQPFDESVEYTYRLVKAMGAAK